MEGDETLEGASAEEEEHTWDDMVEYLADYEEESPETEQLEEGD